MIYYFKNRKYPRIYQRDLDETDNNYIEINISTAIGIVAGIFVSGIALGCALRRII